jgi:methylenetetrahydrofolate reductase (NADPH)
VDKKRCLVEILTPKLDSEKLDEDIETFAGRFQTVVDNGYVVSLPDNPMGILRAQPTEIITELGLEPAAGQVLIHINTFHTRPHLDQILRTCADRGFANILVISGDGGERLAKLAPESIGASTNAVTSVELLQFIHKAYPGTFHCSVAFNPYEPQDHEVEKMRRKVAAGARAVITQPLIGRDDRVAVLASFGLPVTVEAFMSKKLHLLSECVGYTIPENQPYDPMENLKTLRREYPDAGVYLSLLGFKTQFPLLSAALG